MADRSQSFTAVVAKDSRHRVLVPVPFDPDKVWGPKRDHQVHGTASGMGVRAVIEPLGDGYGILLGLAWRRDCSIAPGGKVDVVLAPEDRSATTSPRTWPPHSTLSPPPVSSSTRRLNRGRSCP